MMRVQYDRDVDALYVRVRVGRVAETVELRDAVSADLDADGEVLGLEFANADDVLPFLRGVDQNDADSGDPVRCAVAGLLAS